MTEKLTAKLSDGREFEVTKRFGWSGFCAADPSVETWVVKPIVPKPVEYWVIGARSEPHWFEETPFSSRERAEERAAKLNIESSLNDYYVRHFREVLE